MHPPPRVDSFDFVVVSGPPGSGKSTIAPSLARHLGLPLFAKDTIKEALMDALGVHDPEESRRLGAASIALLLALARENGSGVLESNWKASVSVDELRGLPGRVVEVFCACTTELSRARHAGRRRHAGHFDAERAADDELWLGEASRPLGGGWPVIEIDTSCPVDVDELAARIRAGIAP
jgi:predicted kinase